MTDKPNGVAAGIPMEVRRAAIEDVFKSLAKMERISFRKVLSELIGAKPTVEAVAAFAEKHPDRWAQAVSIMAGLAGFDRGIGPTINVYNVADMSDAQLLQRRAELDRLTAAKDVTAESVAMRAHANGNGAESVAVEGQALITKDANG